MIRWAQHLYKRFSPALPAVAFFAGFIWDAATLGIRIKSSDLWIVFAYLISAFASQALIIKNIFPSMSKYYPWLIQFFLGGIFSALAIFYFKSSSQLFSYFIVLIIFVLLVLNEFLGSHYSRERAAWLMLTASCAMFLNFSLPHLFGSLLPIWFYGSLCLTAGVIFSLQKLICPKPAMAGPGLVLGALFLFYVLNAIPPVPLVQKEMVVCQNIQKAAGVYSLEIERLPWYQKLNPGTQVHKQKSGRPVYCFSSVFAPEGLSARIFHHWQWYNPKSGSWESQDKIGFNIASGRESGYRGYTFKNNVQEGLWKIRLETGNGKIIGQKKFHLKKTAEEETFSTRILNFR